MFNLLKLRYRQSNVYMVKQTIQLLDDHPQMTATEFNKHRDWDNFLDQLYTRFDPCTMKKYHNFSFSALEGKTRLIIRISKLTTDQDTTKHKDFLSVLEIHEQ